MADIKQHLVEVGRKWINEQVDVAVEHNPRLSFIATRLKEGLGNMLANKVDMIDPYMPFITDERGQFNVTSVSEELLNAFDEMPVRDYDAMGLAMQVGKGRVVVMFPDNFFTNLLLDNNKLVFGRADLQEFFNALNNR